MTRRSTHEVPTSDQELLVAYLDGELESDQAAQVERRLAKDSQFRLSLTELRETWDLLDELPQPTLDDGFAQTTVEMVAIKASSDPADASQPGSRRFVATVAWGLACTILGLTSFAMVRHWQTAGDRELIQDLSVIENVDAYAQIGSLEFLEALAQQGIFSDEELQEGIDDVPQ